MNPISKLKSKGLACVLTCLLFAPNRSALGQLAANFSSNLTEVCTPILVHFTDQSTGNPTEWKWDLGNGTFSNLQNPSVTYFNPGLYSIKLWVKVGNNRDSLVKTNYIKVNQAPTVNFTANTVTGCNPITVNFSDNSVANGGSITSWQWDFGDGIISNLQHPSHTYTLYGTYSVTLKVINSNGCTGTLRKTNYITNNGITAAFTSNIFSTCRSNKIIFQNNSSSNGIISSQWDFGDGQTSQSYNPTHIYTAGGNYIVKLIVRSQHGCIDSFSSNLQVFMSVTASFTGNNLMSCRPPLTVNFTNQQLQGNTYLWDFGDSSISSVSNPVHTFTDTGAYSIKLIVRNSNGCADTLQRDNYVNIQKPFLSFANLPDSGCSAFRKYFLADINPAVTITNYSWNFGDGSFSSAASPLHTFSNTGYYDITLTGTASTGCRDTLFMPRAIRVSTKPVAAFSASSRFGCASEGITFTNLSSGGVTAWEWDFGDQIKSNEQSPVYVYTDTGWMNVQLVAMNGGCRDTAVLLHYIYIKPAVAKFDIIMNRSNKLVRTFRNFSIGASRCQWDFGDGTFSTVYQPVHTFPGGGTYSVKLTVWNDSTGCSYSKTKKVVVLNVTPTFYSSDTVICKGSTATFISGPGSDGIAKNYWNFGDSNTTSATTYNHIAYTYQQTGIYSVRLITQDSLNCRDTLIKPMYIKVMGPKARFRATPAIACVNSIVLFSDSSLAGESGPLRKWIWNYGDGIIDTLVSPPFRHLFTTGGSYHVSLKLIDSAGCTDVFKLKPPLTISKVTAWFFIRDSVACPSMPVRMPLCYLRNLLPLEFW